MVAPKANEREPNRAATYTEGITVVDDRDPSSDDSPGRGGRGRTSDDADAG